jgi:hypothetical protein
LLVGSAIHAFFANIGKWEAELASLLTNRFRLTGYKTSQVSSV